MEKVHSIGFIVGKFNFKRFINDFRTITQPLNDLVKKNVVFKWGEMQENAFNLLRKKLSKASLFLLPSLYKTFEIRCDACGLAISAVLIQDGKSLVYFSEKLNGATLKYPTFLIFFSSLRNNFGRINSCMFPNSMILFLDRISILSQIF